MRRPCDEGLGHRSTKKHTKLNKEYHERQFSRSIRLDAESRQRECLFVGQVIQAQYSGTFWYPAEVIELLPKNRVLVKNAWRFQQRSRFGTVSKIQLAPDLVDQPSSAQAKPLASSRRSTVVLPG